MQEEPLRAVFAARGRDYDAARAANGNPLHVGDPGGELWLDGSDTTRAAASPTGLLQAVRDAVAHGAKVRAAYVADAELGTRWFADKAIWVRDGTDYHPFGTVAGAHRYLAAHPGGVTIDYQQALGGSL